MERERVQRVLRQLFGFRLVILLSSLLAFYTYYIWNASWSDEISGIVLGLSGSALVWAFVELFDIFVETNQKYVEQRIMFLRMLETTWSNLRDVLKNRCTEKTIPWDEVKKIIEELSSQTSLFPFKAGIYSISEEYESAVYYILRLDWKLHGYNCSPKKDDSIEYWHGLYNDIVWVLNETGRNPRESVENIKNWEKNMEALRSIEVNFKPFDYPNKLVKKDCKGDLEESFDIFTGDTHYKTLKLKYDFREEFHEEPPRGTFMTVMNLLLRRLRKLS